MNYLEVLQERCWMSCAGGELHGDTVEAMLARLCSRRRYRGSELDGRELDGRELDRAPGLGTAGRETAE